ncbi:mCG15025, partial [Mus musculus]
RMSERAGPTASFPPQVWNNLQGLSSPGARTGSATSQKSQGTLSTEVAALTPAALSKDMMSLQLGTAGKERQLAEKSRDLQNVSMTEGSEEVSEMDHISDRPDEKDKPSENLQTDSLYKTDTEKWVS